MLNVQNNEILDFMNKVHEEYRKSGSAPLFFDKFTAKSYKTMFEQSGRTYPYTVKIPKPIDRLLKGDLEPAYEFTVNEPIRTEDGTPIWFGDSSSGVALRFGYKNGDSRFLSDVVLNDKDIHAILAGMTGMGKSVTTNSIIFGMAFEYAPWELKLTLADAKIVEFKRYALGYKLPHISSIAATGDADYLISVLEDLSIEMEKMNTVFAMAGVQNIKDFRKKTGLCIPQNVITMDEFQTMFKKAGKKAGKIASIIDSFGRLGRNTGYHLYLASQEVGSDLPANTLNQIQIRCALGCAPNVSDMILGNDEAKSLNQKGRLLVNTNSNNKNKKDNVLYRVPFQSASLFDAQSKFLEDIGNSYGFKYNMSFYDEQAVKEEAQYRTYIEGFNNTKNKIYLGEPSFVMHSKENCVSMEMTGDDIENILVLSNNNSHLERYMKMLKINFETLKDRVKHIVFLADKSYEQKCKISEIAFRNYDLKSSDSVELMMIYYSIYNRRLMVDVDTAVFSGIETSEQSDKLFYQIFDKGCAEDTELNRSRCHYMWDLMLSPTYEGPLGLKGLNSTESYEKVKDKIETMISGYKSYNSSTTRLTIEKLPPTYIWIAGLNRVLGFGRDSKSKEVETFKKVLQDCTDVNMRFILFSTTMEDMDSLRSGIRYYIFDDTPAAELRRCKYEDYPEDKPKVLGVLYDSLATGEKTLKFKKMVLDGEIL